MEIITLVIYDISSDELREKVANFLKAMGLKRVQKSAFAGLLAHSRRIEVIAGLKKLARKGPVNIQIYPLTPASFNQREIIGVNVDYEGGEELVT
ncbi:MAG: CRISPR-associated endonuclease Cas2 [Candidatus Bathyarchaeaceae archaeon]